LWEDDDGIEHLKIRIRAATKRGVSRTVISQPDAVEWIRAWKSISHYKGDQDLVWYGQSKVGAPQVPASDLNKTFQQFLRTVEHKGREGGLLFDGDGGKRSLYSIRHYYAGQRLLHNVSYEDLRRNMGTGLAQLSRHYDHVLTEQRAAEITKTKVPIDPEAR
jgi:integrase